MWTYMRFVMWVVGWTLAWVFIRPFKTQNKNNCLLWTWEKWDREGGYLVIRWCRVNRVKWFKWPHFLWLDEKHHKLLEHFTPIRDPNSPVDKEFFPRPWFEGKVVKGDYKKEYVTGKKPWFVPAIIYNKIRPTIDLEN